jgi:two-component system, NtrC family, sensor kinase
MNQALADATEPGAARTAIRQVWVASLVGLVAIVLIGNVALDVWLSYKETKPALVRIQQETAESAAQRIGAFVEEIERQIGWTTHTQWSPGTVDERRLDCFRLLRQAQLKVSRLAMDVVGSGTDYSGNRIH